MAAAESVSPIDKDKWVEERDVMHAGVVGTRLLHYYTGRHAANSATALLLSDYSLEEGDAMPDCPASGIGSTATITNVKWLTLKGSASRAIVVEGFEAKGWED